MSHALDVLAAEYVITATDVRDLPPPLYAEVAFAGRSNVGKSSLINSLTCRKKLARTSSTPGCTRGLNLFRLKLRGGAQVDFIDLPGYGFAQRSKMERLSWGPMIESCLTQRVGLRGVLVLVDARRGVEHEERELFEFLAHIGKPAILVATKIDRVPASKRKSTVAKLAKEAGTRAIGVSSETGEGREQLWASMARLLGVVADPKAREA